jgi:cytochrome b561
LNVLFVAVVIGHLAAALKHHFIDRDDILTRMLPSRSTTHQEHRS